MQSKFWGPLVGLAWMLFCGLAALHAQDFRSESYEKMQAGIRRAGYGQVTCLVLFGDTRSIARGVRVVLQPLAADGLIVEAITGLDGTALLDHVPAGEYVATAFAYGYLSALDGVGYTQTDEPEEGKKETEKLRRKGPVLFVSGGQTTATAMTLQRGAALSGRVLYADGTPAGGLVIRVLAPEDQGVRPRPHDLAQSHRERIFGSVYHTDDEGSFRIAGLAAGSYRLEVTQILQYYGQGTGVTEYKDSQLKVYSGDTVHEAQAKVFKVLPGDVVKTLRSNYRSSGCVRCGGWLPQRMVRS